MPCNYTCFTIMQISAENSPVNTAVYGPGVDSASNRNEYQEYFLGVKAAGA